MVKLRVALCQLNPTAGDLEGNADRVISWMADAAARKARLVVFPELAISGYGAGDLFLRRRFFQEERAGLLRIAKASRQFPGLHVLVGCLDRMALDESAQGSGHCGSWPPWGDVANKELLNSAALISEGRIAAIAHKRHLPTYGIFDELRWFREGNDAGVMTLAVPDGVARIGVSICADLWWDDTLTSQALQGAQLFVNLSASPYHAGKSVVRERLLSRLARKHRRPIAYVNSAGSHDGIVHYGRSYVVDAGGRIVAEAPLFEEALLVADVPLDGKSRGGRMPLKAISEKGRIAEMRLALVTGLRDYALKNSFSSAVLGLSGGIDSAVVACLAAEALGPRAVRCLFMPTRFTSEQSARLARSIAGNLGVSLTEVPLDSLYESSLAALEPGLGPLRAEKAGENVQARLRAMALMAHSNRDGSLALNCGNKSELATGYCTLYGDMAGGLSVLGDVYKTEVYALARHINAERKSEGKKQPIPQEALARQPTAELREGQTDQDTLPAYEVLDRILASHLGERKSAVEIVHPGLPEKTVRAVLAMVRSAEFKRKQMPPCIVVSDSPLGAVGRIFPVTNLYSS